MEDRELRNRLQRIDPVASGVEIKAVTDQESRQMLEKIMDQQINDTPNRTMQYLVSAAAVVALVVGGFAIFGGSDSPVAATLELDLGSNDALASCIAPSAEVLADVQTAFKGTVTSVDGENATLSVDEWYLGGTAENVSLFAPAGLEALIGTIDFRVGDTYLVSAWDGAVNYCGLSGEATPGLQAMYDEAFAG